MYDHQYFKEMRAGANLKKADEERFFDAFIKIAASPVDAAILDIGCGRGDLLARFVASGVRDVYGCDFSPSAVELTRDRLAPLLGESVARNNIRLGSATDRTLYAEGPLCAEGTFDRIFLTDVVEHLPQPDLEAALANVAYWLKPDGIAIIHTFPTERIHQLYRRYLKLCRGRAMLEKVDAIHCNVQTVRRLTETIEDAGLTCSRTWLQNDFVLASTVFQGLRSGFFKTALTFGFERVLNWPIVRSIVHACGMDEFVYPSIYCVCKKRSRSRSSATAGRSR